MTMVTWWYVSRDEGFPHLMQVLSVHGTVRACRNVENNVWFVSVVVTLKTVDLSTKRLA